MTIRILNSDFKALESVKPGRVVNVRIIERKGSEAVIDINGARTRAGIETDTPEDFFAYVEQDGGSVRLRVVDRLKGSGEFQARQQELFRDSVRNLLMAGYIPVNEASLGLAGRVHAAGIKLDAAVLKWLYQAQMRFGPDLANAVIGMLRNGLLADAEFPEFFFHIGGVFRKLQEKNRKAVDSEEVLASVLSGKSGGDSAATLWKVMQNAMAGCLFYKTVYFEYGGRDYLVHAGKEGKDGRERFTFGIDGEEAGSALIVIDRSPGCYEIGLFLEDGLYHKLQDAKSGAGGRNPGKELEGVISRAVSPARAVLTVARLENRFAFWRKDRESVSDRPGFGNLDLYA